MLTRILRDPALRLLPVWVAMVATTVSVVMGVLVLNATKNEQPLPAVPLVVVGWLGVALFLLFGKVRVRASAFDLTLPLTARRLWLGHVLGVLLAGTVIALTILAVVMAHRLLPGTLGTTLGPWALLASLLSGLCLAVALMESQQPSLAEVSRSRGYFLRTGAILAGVLALLLLISAGHVAWTVVPALVAIAIGMRTYGALPEAFTVVPSEAQLAAAGAGTLAGTGLPVEAGPPSRWIVWQSALRISSCGAKDLLGYPLLAVIGLMLGGALEVVAPDEDLKMLRYLYVPLATYMMFTLVPLRLGRLHNVDFLPLSRRLLFFVVIVPQFAMMWLGYGAGVATAELFDRREELVSFEETRAGYRVGVPLRYTEVAWDGEAPAYASPWGEAHAPTPWSPFMGSRAALYSPFGTTEDSSKEFVALQISRAAEAVYGASISPAEIEARYLATAEDGSVVPIGAGLTLRQDFPRLVPRPAGPMFPVMLTVVCVPWLLLVALLLRTYRAGASNATRLWIYWGFLGLLLFVLIGESAAMLTRLTAPWFVSAVFELPVQRLGESVAATSAAWVLGMLLVIAGYLVAERQFLRMEIPTRPTKYSLIDWTRDGT